MIWQNTQGYTLKTRRTLRLFQTFHQVQAYLLFPPECTCEDPCLCARKRKQIVRSLNVDFYNRAVQDKQPSEFLKATRFFLDIPGDRILLKNYGEVYPLWLIREEFQKKIDTKELQCAFELVMILLRLGATYEILFRERQASLKEALEVLLGDMPIERIKRRHPENYFGGGKMCMGYWNTYRPVAHFIGALGIVVFSNKDFSDGWPLDLEASDVEHFLKLACWFREALLALETPNVKGKTFLGEEDLLPLPSWVHKGDVSVPLKPFEEKIQELLKTQIRVDPKETFQRRLEREKQRAEQGKIS